MYNDLSGDRYDMLFVIRRIDNSKDGHIQYLCQCDCGNYKIVKANNLRNGKTHSCGCLKKKIMADKQYKHGDTGGHSGKSSRLYCIWSSMKDRCFRSNFRQWKDYGGRGIKVCDEWRNNYSVFKTWALSNGYHEGLTIDRINNDGNYEPCNCRWVTMKEQMNNKNNNHNISYNGKCQSLTKWAEELGIRRKTLDCRINRYHWPIEKALTTPVRGGSYGG